jgi:nitroreductase
LIFWAFSSLPVQDSLYRPYSEAIKNFERFFREQMDSDQIPGTSAGLDLDMPSSPVGVFIWAAVFEGRWWKHEQGVYADIYLDTRYVARNLALAAGALGPGTCQIAALYAEEVSLLLGHDREEGTIFYVSKAGYPR